MSSGKKFYPTFSDSVRLLIRLLGLSFLFSIPLLVTYLILKETIGIEHPVYNSFILLLSYTLPFYLVVRLGLKRIRKWTIRDYRLRFRKLPWMMFALIQVTGLALIILLNPIESLVPLPDFFADSYASMISPDFASFLTIVVAAPVLEEILFRGIILEGFLLNYPPRKAILLSALLFGAVHFNPVQVVAAFLIGIFLGWVYFRTRTLLPVIGLHLLNNLLSFIFFLRYGEQVIQEGIPLSNQFWYWIMIGLAGILGAAGIWFIRQKSGKEVDPGISQKNEGLQADPPV